MRFLALQSWLQAHSIKYLWGSKDVTTKELWSIHYAGPSWHEMEVRSKLPRSLYRTSDSRFPSLSEQNPLRSSFWTGDSWFPGLSEQSSEWNSPGSLVWASDSWSDCFLLFTYSPYLFVPSSSCIFLRTTKVQLLGSITFSYILKLILTRKEFTSCWSFLARLRVIGPWIKKKLIDMVVCTNLYAQTYIDQSAK
jgi:hypothetical protein